MNDKQLTRLRRERIGFIFQAFNLVPTLTARENITLPLDLAGRKVDTGWFEEVVETLGLSDRLGHRPTELSGGQQQRVAAARAMVSRPGHHLCGRAHRKPRFGRQRRVARVPRRPRFGIMARPSSW